MFFGFPSEISFYFKETHSITITTANQMQTSKPEKTLKKNSI
jgi:hypothetical protein